MWHRYVGVVSGLQVFRHRSSFKLYIVRIHDIVTGLHSLYKIHLPKDKDGRANAHRLTGSHFPCHPVPFLPNTTTKVFARAHGYPSDLCGTVKPSPPANLSKKQYDT